MRRAFLEDWQRARQLGAAVRQQRSSRQLLLPVVPRKWKMRMSDRSWRASLHADERDPQRHHPLSLVCERHAYRGGTHRHGRRRFRELSSRSAARKAHRTPSRARVVSSSRRIDGFCLLPMAATIRFPASVWTKTAGSRCWTSSRRGTPSRERAAPPNRWPMPPREERFSCCTRSAPTIVRLMSVDGEGKLTARPERYTVNTNDKTDRVPTMVVLSPDEKFLLVGTTFDEPPVRTGLYPDGSPILWVQRPGGTFHVDRFECARSRRPRRLPPARGRHARHSQVLRRERRLSVLHRLPAQPAGYLRHRICRRRRHAPWATIDGDGKINIGPLVKIDTSAGLPSELCWLAVSPDDRTVFATNFGYSNISSYHINGNGRWKSRRIPRARRFRETAPPGGSTEPSSAARPTTGSRRMAPISTRSTGMPRNWWATRRNRTVRSRRSPA